MGNEPTKKCPKCGGTKPLDGFHRSKASKDGASSYCKPCAAIIAREYGKKRKRKKAQRGIVPRKALDVIKRGREGGSTEMELQEAVRQVAKTSAHTNAALLAKQFMQAGLDPNFLAEVVKEAAGANLWIMAPDEDRDKPIRVWKEYPDWKTRAWAVKTVIEVCGYLFKEQKDTEQVPAYVFTMFNDYRKMRDSDLLAEARDLGVEVPSESRVVIGEDGD